MNRRIAILAALPAELKPLTAGWRKLRAPRHVSLWTQTDKDGDELVAACAGMGALAARRAFQAAESCGPLDLVLSVGFSGATEAGVHIAEVFAATEIVDVQTGERVSLGQGHRPVCLASTPRTAGAQEKARLLATYGAALVDMEAATVARLAAMRSVPIGCVKAVSDTASSELPEIDAFVDSEGQLSVPKFVLHLAGRPRLWGAVARLAKASKQASEALAVSLRQFLEHKDWEHTSRTGKFVKHGTA